MKKEYSGFHSEGKIFVFFFFFFVRKQSTSCNYRQTVQHVFHLSMADSTKRRKVESQLDVKQVWGYLLL